MESRQLLLKRVDDDKKAQSCGVRTRSILTDRNYAQAYHK